nr:uncharacterized protein LOC129258586 [Lytechinus pictus]
MESNQRVLPPKTSPVTIEVSLNHRRKDLPANSIAAVQVKHDATVSMKIPLLKQPRYRSEAFLAISPSLPNPKEVKFRNSVEHIPTGSKTVSQGSKFARGALKASGEECNRCVLDHSGKEMVKLTSNDMNQRILNRRGHP